MDLEEDNDDDEGASLRKLGDERRKGEERGRGAEGQKASLTERGLGSRYRLNYDPS